MAGVALANPRLQFFDSSGNPLAGGFVYTYLAGTTTATTTWEDRAKTTANTNPIELDAAGSCLLWLDSTLTYKLVVTDSAGVTQSHLGGDNIVGAAGAAILSDIQAVADDSITEIEGLLTETEAARDIARTSANLFSSTTTGLAGTSSGQYFTVKQAFGDAADEYLNSAGTAVKQTNPVAVSAALTVAQAVQLGSASSIVGTQPYTPIIDLNMAAMYDRDGRCVPGAGVVSVSKNMVAENSGRILKHTTSSVTTETEFYANGPQGSLTAKRLVISNSGSYDFIRDVVIPAGPYTVKFQAKATGGADQSFNYGVLAGGGGSMTAGSALTAGWTQFSFTVTPNGSTDTPRVSLSNTSGAAIDILIDEIQWYLDGETIPAFSAETHTQPVLKHEIAYSGSLRRYGNALDARTTLVRGFIPFSTFPLTKTFTEVTMMALVSATDDTIVASKILTFDGTEGTCTLGTQSGYAYAAPVLPRGTTNPAHYIKDLGFHVLTLRVKAGEQAFWIDKFKHTVGSTASPTIPTKTGLLLGNDDSYVGDRAFRGLYSNVKVFDRWLTDAEVVEAYNVMVAQHQLAGLAAPDTDTIWISEGDSIPAETSTTNGPNFQAQYIQGTPAAGIICQNNAVSGSQLSHLTTRLTSTSLTSRIALAVANGYQVIVSVLVGANGLPTIAALETYWNALKTAGAQVVACTILPRDDGTINNTDRKALNVQILASTVPDAFADIAANVDIGADGAPTAGVYYYDLVHLNTAGHAIAEPIVSAAVESLR